MAIKLIDRSDKAKLMIKLDAGEEAIDGVSALICQYFPETITPGYGTTWDQKQIDGGSHPLYQWKSGNESTLTFSLTLFRESLKSVVGASPEPATIKAFDNYNINIEHAIGWLQSLMYPKYGTNVISPPPIVKVMFGPNPDKSVAFPNTLYTTRSNEQIIRGFVSAVDPEIQKFFMDGTMKKATVSITITEVVQNGTGITFIGRK